MSKVAVLGSGSWGLALAVELYQNRHDVTVWSYSKEETAELESTRRTERLKDLVLPLGLKFTSDMEEAVSGAELIVMVVPSFATRSTAETLKEVIEPGQVVVTATKGIEEGSLMTQTDILADVLGKDVKIGVLSGPSHAEEVCQNMPTLVVAASDDVEVAKLIQDIFMSEVFRVYTSTDMIGVEIGASLKNVIAIAAGMSDGIGYGDNAKAALVSRAIKEMIDLVTAMGGSPDTMNGLAGMGDLMVTAFSRHSRNRMFGMLMGQGLSMDEALERVNMTVEGIYTAKAAMTLANKYNLQMPIVTAVNEVLFNDLPVKKAVALLMGRSKKSEF